MENQRKKYTEGYCATSYTTGSLCQNDRRAYFFYNPLDDVTTTHKNLRVIGLSKTGQNLSDLLVWVINLTFRCLVKSF